MKATYLPLVIQCGESFVLDVQAVLDDGTTPMNITGYTVQMKARDGFDLQLRLTTDGDATIPANGVLGTSIVDGPTGRLRVTATDVVTAALQAALLREGVYTLNVISGSGTVTRLAEGPVAYSYEATN